MKTKRGPAETSIKAKTLRSPAEREVYNVVRKLLGEEQYKHHERGLSYEGS